MIFIIKLLGNLTDHFYHDGVFKCFKGYHWEIDLEKKVWTFCYYCQELLWFFSKKYQFDLSFNVPRYVAPMSLPNILIPNCHHFWGNDYSWYQFFIQDGSFILPFLSISNTKTSPLPDNIQPHANNNALPSYFNLGDENYS